MECLTYAKLLGFWEREDLDCAGVVLVIVADVGMHFLFFVYWRLHYDMVTIASIILDHIKQSNSIFANSTHLKCSILKITFIHNGAIQIKVNNLNLILFSYFHYIYYLFHWLGIFLFWENHYFYFFDFWGLLRWKWEWVGSRIGRADCF